MKSIRDDDGDDDNNDNNNNKNYFENDVSNSLDPIYPHITIKR